MNNSLIILDALEDVNCLNKIKLASQAAWKMFESLLCVDVQQIRRIRFCTAVKHNVHTEVSHKWLKSWKISDDGLLDLHWTLYWKFQWTAYKSKNNHRYFICLICHGITREQVSPDHETACQFITFEPLNIKMAVIPKQISQYFF